MSGQFAAALHSLRRLRFNLIPLSRTKRQLPPAVPRIASYALIDIADDEELSTPKQVRLRHAGLPGSLPVVRYHAVSVDDMGDHAVTQNVPHSHPTEQVSLALGSPDLGFSVGQCSRQGRRARMEDRVLIRDLTGTPPFERDICTRALLLGVFDGHAGVGMCHKGLMLVPLKRPTSILHALVVCHCASAGSPAAACYSPDTPSCWTRPSDRKCAACLSSS